jgi:hypothetical protein
VFVLGTDSVDTAAHEDPQRLLQQKGQERVRVVGVEFLLLVKSDEAGRQVETPAFFVGIVGEVQDAVVLPEAVLVEIRLVS